MDCACIYVDSEDSQPDTFRETKPKARKQHKCGECSRTIERGEIYSRESGIWENGPETYKTCSDCLSIRNEFFCDGGYYGQIIDCLREHISESDGDISGDCISSLTPRARNMVCDMIQEYWDTIE